MNHVYVSGTFTSRRWVLLASLTAFAATSCTPAKTGSSATYPRFESLDTLTAASAVVVQGRAEGPPRRTLEGGAHVALFAFSVTRFKSAAGSGVNAPATITVVMPDTTSAQRRGETSIDTDHEYVLFLDQVDEAERDGLKGEGTVYSAVGGPAGIFVVEGDVAVPSTSDLVDYSRAEPLATRDGRKVVALSRVFAG